MQLNLFIFNIFLWK